MSRGLSLTQRYEGTEDLFDIAWSADGMYLAGGLKNNDAVIWRASVTPPQLLGRLAEREPLSKGSMTKLAWHPNLPIVAIGANDGVVRMWNAESNTLEVFCNIGRKIRGLAWSPKGSSLTITDSSDESIPDHFENAIPGRIGIWGLQTRELQNEVSVESYLNSPRWSPDGKLLFAPGSDGVINIYASDLRLMSRLHGHAGFVFHIDISPDGRLVVSASSDNTVRVWDTVGRNEIITLEGHSSSIMCAQFSPHGDLIGSLGHDGVRLWRCRDWECVSVISSLEASGIGGLAFHPSLPLLAAKSDDGQIYCYSIDYELLGSEAAQPGSRRYVNAKVVLLGDTGVGKSGLSLVLSGQPYAPTDSTHGRRVWTIDTEEVALPGGTYQAREILLWDLAGQPGYRLIHQLHLNEVAVALVVFDSRSESDPFSGVKYWVRALNQARRLEATGVPLRAYLVAARADRGGVAVSDERMQTMIGNLGLDGFFETSAKEGWQITELASAIRSGISWDALPMVSSSALFDSIKQFLLEEKKQARVLCTADDLFRSFLQMNPESSGNDRMRASFETCIGRIESRGLIRRLHFGGLILLQPELLDAYASAMVQAAKEEPDGLGYITEDAALAGSFRLADEERLKDKSQEKLLLIATIEELLRHEIALREITDQQVDLVFPSQFTRELPDAPDIPGKQVTFVFDGPLHGIYASLAVRLAHSTLFRRKSMWQNAATYSTTVGGTCGIHLRELEEGRGELLLFYDELADATVRSQFEIYVSEHLRLRALPETVTRYVVRSCLICGYVLPGDLVQGKLNLGMSTTRCPLCEKSIILLIDEEPSVQAEAAVSVMNRSANEGRDRGVATAQLKGKIETGDYDVFLCHNSRDKPQVMAIGERLKEHGILPWLDAWEIRPGMRWQKVLERNLKSIKSAAVFIGARGGPWQELEVEFLLQQFIKRKKSIIPVILEERHGNPRLPPFLSSWHMVDMRNSDPDPFGQLIWGITGVKSAS